MRSSYVTSIETVADWGTEGEQKEGCSRATTCAFRDNGAAVSTKRLGEEKGVGTSRRMGRGRTAHCVIPSQPYQAGVRRSRRDNLPHSNGPSGSNYRVWIRWFLCAKTKNPNPRGTVANQGGSRRGSRIILRPQIVTLVRRTLPISLRPVIDLDHDRDYPHQWPSISSTSPS